LHIPHFLFLGGSEEVGPGLLVPLGPGNTCPKEERNRMIEVYITRMKDLNCESQCTLSKKNTFLTIKVENIINCDN
jgi:hypothetical protein